MSIKGSLDFGNIEHWKVGLITKKYEFLYADFFPVREGVSYSIFYTKDKEELFLTENRWQVMIKNHPIKDRTMFGEYRSSNASLVRELYLKPYKLELNKTQKEDASVTRAFARQTNIKDGCIFEINPKLLGNKLTFYKTVRIEWRLNGSKDEILLRNTEELKKADRIINGISDMLDPLELYEEELTPQQLVEEKLNILYHNPYSYKIS